MTNLYTMALYLYLNVGLHLQEDRNAVFNLWTDGIVYYEIAEGLGRSCVWFFTLFTTALKLYDY